MKIFILLEMFTTVVMMCLFVRFFLSVVQQGWRFATDAARMTHESPGSEDCKRTSGGVFVAIDSDAVIDNKELLCPSMGMKEGSLQVWVNVRGGIRIFVVSFFGTQKDGRRGLRL